MKIEVGDTDDGSLDGACCPQCNREEDDDGGIIEVDMEEPFNITTISVMLAVGSKFTLEYST